MAIGAVGSYQAFNAGGGALMNSGASAVNTANPTSSGGGASMGAASFVSSLASAFMTIQQAKTAQAIGNYNAGIIENQLPWIDMQLDIAKEQYARKKNKLISSGTAQLGASGLKFSGSPLAYMLDAVTQIEIDEAITTANLEMNKVTVKAQAGQARVGGQRAMSAGRMNAYSEILKGTSDAALYKYGTKGK